MRLITLLFMLSYDLLLAQQPVSKVAFSASRSSVRAFSQSGESMLPTVRVQLEIQTPDRKIERGNLLVVYDPDSGHYLWRNSVAASPGDTTSLYTELESGRAAVYAGSAGLALFYMPGNLYVQQHTQHADNLDAAEHESILEIERRALENNLYGSDMKEVTLYSAISRDFACAPFERGREDRTAVMCGFTVKSIVSVSRDSDNWRLVIRNRWDQEIILNSKFELVSTRRLPPVN
jgi:hypothetical protein